MLRATLVFAILIVGLGAGVWSRFAALLLYVWFALFRPQEFLWFDISGWHPSLLIGALLVIPSLLTGVFPNLTHVLSLGSVLFLFTALIAQSNAFNPPLAWAWLDYLARLILISLLAVSLIDTKRRFLWMVGVMAGSFGFYSAKAGLASLMGGGLRFFDGLAGAFIDNNAYALGAAMVMPLLMLTAQNLPMDSAVSRWTRRLFFAAIPLSAMLIVSTFSRAGFLALVAALLTYIMLQRGRRLAILATLVLTLAVVGPFIPIPRGYFDRLETIRTYEQIDEESAVARLHFWRVAINMALDNPSGVGLRNFDAAYDRYDFLDGTFGRGRSVHNSHFQVLAEQGFLGAAVYLGLFCYAFLAGWRIRRWALNGTLPDEHARFYYTSANGLMTSMTAFLVGGSFIALALNDLTWLTFALVAALDRLARRDRLELPIPEVDVEAVPTDVLPSFSEPAALGGRVLGPVGG
jgi:probable O-glycosylation ligase (exosortase A-associated)